MGTFTLGPGSGWTSARLQESCYLCLRIYLSICLCICLCMCLCSCLPLSGTICSHSGRVCGSSWQELRVPAGRSEVEPINLMMINKNILQYYTNKRFAVIWKYVKWYFVTLQNSEVGPINLMTINDLRLVSMIYGQGGDFYGKDNTENLSQEIKMDIHYTLDVKYHLA